MVDSAILASRVIIDRVHDVIPLSDGLVEQLAQPDLLACCDRPATPTCCQLLDIPLDPVSTAAFIHMSENTLQLPMVALHRVFGVACFGDLLCNIVFLVQQLMESGLAIRVREVNLADGITNAVDGVHQCFLANGSSSVTVHNNNTSIYCQLVGWWMGEEAYASSPYNRSCSLQKKSSSICSKISAHSSASFCRSVSFSQAASHSTQGLPASASGRQSVCSKSYSAESMAHVRLSHCGIFFAAQQWYLSSILSQSKLLPSIWYCLTYVKIPSACSASSSLIAFCLSCSLVLIAYIMILPILYMLLVRIKPCKRIHTLASVITNYRSFCLSSTRYHRLVSYLFTFQGSTPLGASACFRSFYCTYKGLRCLCFPCFVVLIVPQDFRLVKSFFQNFLNFFRLPCNPFCVVPWSISDYTIAPARGNVKNFFQEIEKKIKKNSGAKIYFVSLVK